MLGCVVFWGAVAYGGAVVVVPFQGPRGAAAAEQLVRSLRGIKVVDAAQYRRLSAQMGAANAARKLNLSAIVRGTMTRIHGRWAVRVTVRNADGRIVSSRTLPLSAPRLDSVTLRRLSAQIKRVAGVRSGGGSRSTRRTPKPKEPKEEDKESDDKKPSVKPKPPEPAGFDDGAEGPIVVGGGTPSATDPEPRRRRSEKPGLGFQVGSSKNAVLNNPEVRPAQRPTRGRKRRSIAFRRGRYVTSTKEKKPPSGRPEWKQIVSASLGMRLINRSLRIKGTTGAPPNYSTPVAIPALSADVELYPFAWAKIPVVSDLGFGGEFYRTFGLKGDPPDSTQLVDSVLQSIRFGLRYRWNFKNELDSPTLRVNVDFTRQSFVNNNQPSVLPGITYICAEPKLALAWTFYAENDFRVGVAPAVAIPIVLSTSTIETSDLGNFGSASIFAFDLSVGLYGSYKGLFGRAELFYRQFKLTFSSDKASSGLDVYGGVAFSVGYAF